MNNAPISDNLGQLANQGESTNDVGQNDGSQKDENSSKNWEEQAKYIQSEKDKLHTENEKLQRYAELGEFLESRPDITDKISVIFCFLFFTKSHCEILFLHFNFHNLPFYYGPKLFKTSVNKR